MPWSSLVTNPDHRRVIVGGTNPNPIYRQWNRQSAFVTADQTDSDQALLDGLWSDMQGGAGQAWTTSGGTATHGASQQSVYSGGQGRYNLRVQIAYSAVQFTKSSLDFYQEAQLQSQNRPVPALFTQAGGRTQFRDPVTNQTIEYSPGNGSIERVQLSVQTISFATGGPPPQHIGGDLYRWPQIGTGTTWPDFSSLTKAFNHVGQPFYEQGGPTGSAGHIWYPYTLTPAQWEAQKLEFGTTAWQLVFWGTPPGIDASMGRPAQPFTSTTFTPVTTWDHLGARAFLRSQFTDGDGVSFILPPYRYWIEPEPAPPPAGETIRILKGVDYYDVFWRDILRIPGPEAYLADYDPHWAWITGMGKDKFIFTRDVFNIGWAHEMYRIVDNKIRFMSGTVVANPADLGLDYRANEVRSYTSGGGANYWDDWHYKSIIKWDEDTTFYIFPDDWGNIVALIYQDNDGLLSVTTQVLVSWSDNENVQIFYWVNIPPRAWKTNDGRVAVVWSEFFNSASLDEMWVAYYEFNGNQLVQVSKNQVTIGTWSLPNVNINLYQVLEERDDKVVLFGTWWGSGEPFAAGNFIIAEVNLVTHKLNILRHIRFTDYNPWYTMWMSSQTLSRIGDKYAMWHNRFWYKNEVDYLIVDPTNWSVAYGETRVPFAGDKSSSTFINLPEYSTLMPSFAHDLNHSQQYVGQTIEIFVYEYPNESATYIEDIFFVYELSIDGNTLKFSDPIKYEYDEHHLYVGNSFNNGSQLYRISNSYMVNFTPYGYFIGMHPTLPPPWDEWPFTYGFSLYQVGPGTSFMPELRLSGRDDVNTPLET